MLEEIFRIVASMGLQLLVILFWYYIISRLGSF